MCQKVGDFGLDGQTALFNKRLWSFMERGFLIPYPLWTLAQNLLLEKHKSG